MREIPRGGICDVEDKAGGGGGRAGGEGGLN